METTTAKEELTWPLDLFTCLLLLVTLTSGLHAATPVKESSAPSNNAPRKPNLAVYPPEIKLGSARDFQSFVAVIRRDDGITEDASDRVIWKVADPSKVKRNGFQLLPIADGQTELIGEYLGTQVKVPITVTGASSKPPISFTNDVMPVLTRAGCNTGSCHGAARGKDGFRLSLFGFDPAGDYHRITREIGVRRINMAIPSESLFVKKAIGSVPHTGGKLFDTKSDYYATLLEWLQAGALMDSR